MHSPLSPFHTKSGSRPARGAWIEILIALFLALLPLSRPARGAWIEIQVIDVADGVLNGRAPQGARGLKCLRAEDC